MNDMPTITITIEEYMHLRACENKCNAEDYRSLKDIKELLERKAKALDGVPIEDGGGACIGIYFSIANDLPGVYPRSDKPCNDCISRNEVDKLAYQYLRETTDNHVAFYEHLLDLPSVYPKSNKPSGCEAEDCISREQALKSIVAWSDEEIIKNLPSVYPKSDKPIDYEKCPYYVPDIMFDGEDEYDVGYCQYKPKSEWQQDHAINKAYADGYNEGISVLEDIKAQIPNLARYESADGQDLIMAYDMARLIDEYISGEEEQGAAE